ncbi:hypothetical protein D6C78_02855 [Aureobasidium pullulans]|uniref:Uncharacterized protein n=1 Tax=Aureobasidium pullulans TaxID=5580 RepID=A0A4S9ERR1_AURPU|nr:hypothetical protein D6D10_06710 [Aureobasidium pullulans]TIA40048.1 hypothetical protein D6C78_02855 [Aureobasidium pullulans]
MDDLENTWEIYRGFITPGRCKHGSFLAGAMQEGRRDIHKNKHRWATHSATTFGRICWLSEDCQCHGVSACLSPPTIIVAKAPRTSRSLVS